MDMNLLTDIPFTLDAAQLLSGNKIKPGTAYANKFEALINRVQNVGKPKAMYTVSYIDEKDTASVIIDGVEFTSIALRKNLDPVERVFPYIVTCGTEVDNIKAAPGDTLESFWLHLLKGLLVESAVTYLMQHIDAAYKTGNLSSMNPGSGDECVWPVEQQKDLFSMFVNVYPAIGVRLSDASVLIPASSLMGIFFQTDVDFQSCQLCHREKCPGRRAPFNEEIWKATFKNP